ncbi:Ubiquinone/menaquinone biosynthesis C-methylase UbiE [Persephonella hydrogeniphila]|uniref:Ubiquinone/menaquinone biosynthesis C-methylase UbiE n=1 Tax=Persephonella hydrogeniphila TaxID=198703 RepID=A0A285NCS4_9AQUI|nr:class I SAM-dependent methyltransferase [Persephonella hydrogeniphila]SNZ06703.1 Ubiquinone/menaquinone biosynthesis C-methylase UbiE [Persephonella hydrogeniphila]
MKSCGCKSRFNAFFMKNLEWYLHHVYGNYKKSLFSKLGKDVLEIGAGTGTNLPYYRPHTNLTVVEPSRDMLNYFLEKAEKYPLNIHVVEGFAERLPFEDNSFDGVVSTLVLCSVSSPSQVLKEIKRVLKPGGVFIFIEHVKAPENTLTAKLQNIVYPGWKWLFEGCDVKRDTGSIISSFFPDATYKKIRFNSPFIPVNYHIIGYGTKRN